MRLLSCIPYPSPWPHVLLHAQTSSNSCPDLLLLPSACSTTVSEAMEDAVLFMVQYLQDVQGPKHVVGRNFNYVAATPEARRLFLSTARHLMLQVQGVLPLSCLRAFPPEVFSDWLAAALVGPADTLC